MKRYPPSWIGLLITALLASRAVLAEVRMSIDKPQIGRLDRAVLSIEFIDTPAEPVTIPPVEGLDITESGTRRETRWINGKSTTRISHTWVVTPAKTGDFTIGPVEVDDAGTQKTLTAHLRVIDPADDPAAQDLSKQLFARIAASHKAPYLQEPFELQLDLYVRDDVQIVDQFALRGGLPDSGLEGGNEWRLVASRREEHDGARYTVHRLASTVTALTAGRFIFQPTIQLQLVVPREQRRPYGLRDPFFEDLFGRQETRPVLLESNRLELEVLPLPTRGQPDSFSGGVGVFDFTVDVDPKQVKVGDPLTVRMRIRGEGNLNRITPPALPENAAFKTYAPRAVASHDSNEVVFEQVVIPRTPETTELPTITFSYFHSKARDFRTVHAGPFPIEVAPASRPGAQMLTPSAGKERRETEILGQDIVYLKPAPTTWHPIHRSRWMQPPESYLLLGGPALALAIALGVQKHRNDPSRTHRQHGPKAVRRTLKQAAAALRAEDPEAFHHAIWSAITTYFAQRFTLPPGDITAQSVAKHLPQQANELATLLGQLEQRRYGMDVGKTTPEAMQQLLDQTTRLLRACERSRPR